MTDRDRDSSPESQPSPSRRRFDDEPSVDAIHRCLADERRRHILRYFHETDVDTTSLAALVAHVIVEDQDVSPSDGNSVRTDLYHVHLPKLAEHGLIDFDSQTRTVQYRGDDRIEAMLVD